MTEEAIIAVGQNAMVMMILIGGPLLLVSLIVGLAVSIFQAVTQINEMTLTFVPKVVGLFIALVILGPWMLSTIVGYTADVFTAMATFTR